MRVPVGMGLLYFTRRSFVHRGSRKDAKEQRHKGAKTQRFLIAQFYRAGSIIHDTTKIFINNPAGKRIDQAMLY